MSRRRALVILAGLSGLRRSRHAGGMRPGLHPYAEREPWRREAEVACLNSGTVQGRAQASSASRRFEGRACAARIFRSRSRRWAKARRSVMRGAGAAAGRDPGWRARPARSRAGRSSSSHTARRSLTRSGRIRHLRRSPIRRRRAVSRCRSSARRRQRADVDPQQQCSARRRPICGRRADWQRATGSRVTAEPQSAAAPQPPRRASTGRRRRAAALSRGRTRRRCEPPQRRGLAARLARERATSVRSATCRSR